MAPSRGFGVLVATDGSSLGRSAVSAAAEFPWPRGARGEGVVSRGGSVSAELPAGGAAGVDGSLDLVAPAPPRPPQSRGPTRTPPSFSGASAGESGASRAAVSFNTST